LRSEGELRWKAVCSNAGFGGRSSTAAASHSEKRSTAVDSHMVVADGPAFERHVTN
jgi:hypothetical protein